jgi:hypothetical protein
MRPAHALHLVRRFAGALVPGGPSPADEAWVASVLSEEELALWRRMSGPDRRHSVEVARRARQSFGDAEPDRPVLAAALLHDVGKVVSGLGTLGRVVATLAGMSRTRRLPARVQQYLAHDRLGGDLLEQAGSHPLTVAWAREHHRPPERWTVPLTTGNALKAADDD